MPVIYDYSYLNATMGSTRVARCAGMEQATSATSASKAAITLIFWILSIIVTVSSYSFGFTKSD
ncbi:MAG TPA: hypothetical protein VJ255_20390 [Candidatus Acidoferrum sp.]|nr:hypothetical protein [Candidatus Acidoferrum sp.]